MSYIALSSTPIFARSTLKAYWPLDGDSTDAKGTNDGTDSSMAYSVTNAKIGSAADFTPQTSKITIPDVAAVQDIFDGGGVYGVWFYPTTTVADAGRIGDKGGDTGNQGWWLATDDASGGNISLHFAQNFANGTQIQVKTAVNIAINTLHHVAVVYDNSSAANLPVIYIDASSVSLTQVGGSPTGARGSDVGIAMGIGQRTSTANVGFKGSLDEIFVLKGDTMTAQEVADLYNGNYGSTNGFYFMSV